MPNTFYLDPLDGNDANDGKGWWKLDFTSGSHEPLPDETVTGHLSSATAKIISVTVSSGTWGGGDAAGTLYLYAKSGTFQAEDLDQGSDLNICTVAADATISAWKTVKDGATAARIAPGDEIRFRKTPKVSAGINATFTLKSSSVTLASALTKTISDCDSAWSPATYVTQSNDGSYKMEGSYAQKFIIGASFTGGIVAYKALGGTQDFSPYQKICFAIYPTVEIGAGVLRIDLCELADGTSPANSLTINRILRAGTYHFIEIDNGGALGASIQSVALYAISDPGTVNIYLDNIEASNDFNQICLIGNDDGYWYPIGSLKGTAITIGTIKATAIQSSPFGKAGGTSTLYYKRPFVAVITPNSTTSNSVAPVQDEGTSDSALISFIGGFNRDTNARDEETWLDGINCLGYGWYSSSKNYTIAEQLGFVRCNNGWYSVSGTYIRYKNISASGCLYGFLDTDTMGHNDNFLQGELKFIGTVSNRAFSLANAKDSNGSVHTVDITVLGFYGVQTAVSIIAPGITINGTIEIVTNTINDLGLFLASPGIRVKKLITRVTYWPLKFSTGSDFAVGAADSMVDECVYYDNPSFPVSVHSSCGLNRIGVMTFPDGVGSNLNYAGSYNPRAQVHIDVFGASNRWKSAMGLDGGILSDQITGGQAASWTHGGSGTCMYFVPISTVRPMVWEFFVPVTSGVANQVHFWVKKTNAAHNPTLKFSAFGMGITAIFRSSVSLTDAWAEFTSDSFTPSYNGYLRCVIEVWQGTTPGNVGIDDIHVATP